MKRTIFTLITVMVGLVLGLIFIELPYRVYEGTLLSTASRVPRPPTRLSSTRAEYDSLLGWIPKAGDHYGEIEKAASIDESGLRRNGRADDAMARSPGDTAPPILALGDSFTYGDEVLDHETWPAHLEKRLGSRVINAGVFAYGIDQAYLRTTVLLERFRPRIVLLAYIGHDVGRNELSYYYAWKPYFEVDSGQLAMHNVPVPRSGPPRPPMDALRSVLGYSAVGSAIARRVAEQWWEHGSTERKHLNGEAVSAALFARLDTLVRSKGASLVVVALGTSSQGGSNQRAPTVAKLASERGVDVLNMIPEVARRIADGEKDLFQPRGHFSSVMNSHVAARIAEYIGPRLETPTR